MLSLLIYRSGYRILFVMMCHIIACMTSAQESDDMFDQFLADRGHDVETPRRAGTRATIETSVQTVADSTTRVQQRVRSVAGHRSVRVHRTTAALRAPRATAPRLSRRLLVTHGHGQLLLRSGLLALRETRCHHGRRRPAQAPRRRQSRDGV
ncbi:MAG: hypothetical protein J07HX5_00398 [halophilic archaeon J07HX5]|nr:MAG: hypothetical protein J07HX5_00398 [halophilic archaeon J07HX5]